jgi:hypothetical protein
MLTGGYRRRECLALAHGIQLIQSWLAVVDTPHPTAALLLACYAHLVDPRQQPVAALTLRRDSLGWSSRLVGLRIQRGLR